jgi:hypothetical protein
MNKGWIPVLVLLLIPLAAQAEGEIYKIVNPDGSVTFTDQRPAPGAEPLNLPPLSVVETEIPVPEDAGAGAEEASREPTARDLQREYRDFRITQPQSEETFWGTGNQVTVSWGASKPIREDLNVTLYVDGAAQAAPAAGSVTLTLDRGEHQVYAVLRDVNKRRIAVTETVTFFVRQHSVNFNRPNPTPRN